MRKSVLHPQITCGQNQTHRNFRIFKKLTKMRNFHSSTEHQLRLKTETFFFETSPFLERSLIFEPLWFLHSFWTKLCKHVEISWQTHACGHMDVTLRQLQFCRNFVPLLKNDSKKLSFKSKTFSRWTDFVLTFLIKSVRGVFSKTICWFQMKVFRKSTILALPHFWRLAASWRQDTWRNLLFRAKLCEKFTSYFCSLHKHSKTNVKSTLWSMSRVLHEGKVYESMKIQNEQFTFIFFRIQTKFEIWFRRFFSAVFSMIISSFQEILHIMWM